MEVRACQKLLSVEWIELQLNEFKEMQTPVDSWCGCDQYRTFEAVCFGSCNLHTLLQQAVCKRAVLSETLSFDWSSWLYVGEDCFGILTSGRNLWGASRKEIPVFIQHVDMFLTFCLGAWGRNSKATDPVCPVRFSCEGKSQENKYPHTTCVLCVVASQRCLSCAVQNNVCTVWHKEAVFTFLCSRRQSFSELTFLLMLQTVFLSVNLALVRKLFVERNLKRCSEEAWILSPVKTTRYCFHCSPSLKRRPFVFVLLMTCMFPTSTLLVNTRKEKDKKC